MQSSAAVPFDLKDYLCDLKIARLLPENLARRLQAILLSKKADAYVVGMVNPQDIFALDELRALFKTEIIAVQVLAQDLELKWDQIYRRENEISDFANQLANELTAPLSNQGTDNDLIERQDPTVIKLINSILSDAIQMNASDIHIEPDENLLRVRLRIDGKLQERAIATENLANISSAVVQHLKLKSGMNIAEKRLPQDGHFSEEILGESLEIRVSTMPINFGESVVLRILHKTNQSVTLENLGMPPQMLATFRKQIMRPHGMILVTGPTGSGKTTTLYSVLSGINDVSKNIVTIEDPIENTLKRINQTQVNEKIGLSFAKILRAILRQDPDIILVGEIRDQETATIALRAALTGHLVFATLHTNDAASTILRLLDMGEESYLVATTVRAIIAQRLIRRICPYCKKQYQPNDLEKTFFKNFFGERFKANAYYKGSGCTYCNNTGYSGRIGIFELLEISVEMQKALRLNQTDLFMEQAKKALAGQSLLDHAFNLVQQQVTTLSEVLTLFME